MQTQTDIANFALAALGAGQINSISDPGDAAILCSNWINDAVASVLLEGQWQAAIQRVLVTNIGPGIDDWLYAFQLPNDCIHLMKCLTTTPQDNALIQSTNVMMFSNQGPSYLTDETQFYVEGSILYANYTQLTFQYVQRPANFGALPVKLNQAIGYFLATLVGPGLSIDLQRLAMVEAKYKSTLGLAGRFEKRDRQNPAPRRKWGDPS